MEGSSIISTQRLDDVCDSQCLALVEHPHVDSSLIKKIAIALNETNNNDGKFKSYINRQYGKSCDINAIAQILNDMGLDAEVVLRYALSSDVQSIFEGKTAQSVAFSGYVKRNPKYARQTEPPT